MTHRRMCYLACHTYMIIIKKIYILISLWAVHKWHEAKKVWWRSKCDAVVEWQRARLAYDGHGFESMSRQGFAPGV